MSKLNQLQVSIVLKVKQIQNLQKHPDDKKMEEWEDRKQKDMDEKLQAFQEKVNNENIDDAMYIEQEKEKIMTEEDWRGYFMAEKLNNSVIFTRT